MLAMRGWRRSMLDVNRPRTVRQKKRPQEKPQSRGTLAGRPKSSRMLIEPMNEHSERAAD